MRNDGKFFSLKTETKKTDEQSNNAPDTYSMYFKESKVDIEFTENPTLQVFWIPLHKRQQYAVIITKRNSPVFTCQRASGSMTDVQLAVI
jgi:hypothetical protein